MIKTPGGHVYHVPTCTQTHTNMHAYTMVFYIIRFSIHSNAGLGWNPMERNKEISEYSSNGDISTAHLTWMFPGCS